MLIHHVQAAGAESLIAAINAQVLNPFIGFLFAVALVYFFFGLVMFLIKRGGSDEDIMNGKRHMLWGIIGMFIMVSVFGIMRVITKSIGEEGINPREVKQDVSR